MGHLDTLQGAMRREGLDVVLLGGEAAGYFAAGHTRIGVQMPGSPIPVTIVPSAGPPHVVTADADGATDLPADHVHGLMWNPATLVSELPRWLGAGGPWRVGMDALSPGGRALVQAALPECELVDATSLLATVMMGKDEGEIEQLADLCRSLYQAAEAGLDGGLPALVEAMQGAFPVNVPQVADRSVVVAARRDGFIGEARLGHGEASVGEAAAACLVAGAGTDELARALPPGVEVVGIGWGYEAPLLRHGLGSPTGLRLEPGAVAVVRWQRCAVTVHVTADGPLYLSPAPEQVVR